MLDALAELAGDGFQDGGGILANCPAEELLFYPVRL